MPYWVGQVRDYNEWLRQERAFLLNSPRVLRSAQDDIAITGYVYNDSVDAARAQSDIGFAIAETGAELGVYRATCVVAGAASSWDAPVSVAVTFTAGAGGTIITDDNSSWVTHGFAAGDLIKIEDAEDAANNNVFRISTITNSAATDDLITVTADDTLAAESADTITAYPIGGGAIFELEYDNDDDGDPTGDLHMGWLASDVETYSKDFTVWTALDRGNADWVVGDYWEWELERGPFTLDPDKIVSVVDATFDNTGDTLTLSAEDIADGITWPLLGFVDEQFLDLLVNSGSTALGRYHITTITDDVLTFGGTPTFTDETVDIEAIPRPRVFSDPVLSVVPANPTITRDDGGSFLDDGFVGGGYAEIIDSVSNEGYWLLDGVTATVLTFDDAFGPVMVTETLPAVVSITPRNQALEAWTEHRYRQREDGALGAADDAISASGVSNGLLVRPTSDGNHRSEWVGIGPGIDPINNPQLVYIGGRTEFTTTTRQNIDHRVFDVVNDSAFELMNSGQPLVASYQLMEAVGTPFDAYFAGDGEHVRTLSDASVAEWSYQGFINVRGTSGQHPRPLFNGAMSPNGAVTRSSTGVPGLISAFWDPASQSSTTGLQLNPLLGASAQFRWVDGQWFPVYNKQRNAANSADVIATPRRPNAGNSFIRTWPWSKGLTSSAEVASPFWNDTGSINDGWLTHHGRSPTTLSVDRTFGLLPITLWMNSPAANILGDLKGITHLPGIGLTTGTRHTRGHRVWILGGNHDTAAPVFDKFCALELT